MVVSWCFPTETLTMSALKQLSSSKRSPAVKRPDLTSSDALIILDVQIDFCPGGALPIKNGDAVIPVLNRWIEKAKLAGVAIYASRDWHPIGHVSFVERGGPWPPHCLQGSPGAAFHPALQLPPDAILITKGTRFDHDQISAFNETGLANQLHHDHIRRVWIGGLAEDVCVRETALDAVAAGFETWVIAEGTKPISAKAGTRARRALEAAGVHTI